MFYLLHLSGYITIRVLLNFVFFMFNYTQQKGVLYAASSGLCYGLVGYFGMQLINSGLSVSCMSFWRFFVATIFCLVALFLSNKKTFIYSRESVLLLFAGMLFYGTSTIAYFLASIYIGTGLAMVTFFVFPAIVILLNLLIYKSRINPIYYFSFTLIILGMFGLVDSNAINFNLLGVVIGLFSAFLYAIYIIASKKISLDSPNYSTLIVSAGCTITSLVASIFDASLMVPSGINAWFNITCMALFCTALPILLLMQALKYISSEQASMLSVLEPVFVVLCGIFLLGEQVTYMQIIGIVAILIGAVMVILPDQKRNVSALVVLNE